MIYSANTEAEFPRNHYPIVGLVTMSHCITASGTLNKLDGIEQFHHNIASHNERDSIWNSVGNGLLLDVRHHRLVLTFPSKNWQPLFFLPVSKVRLAFVFGNLS